MIIDDFIHDVSRTAIVLASIVQAKPYGTAIGKLAIISMNINHLTLPE